MLIPCVLPERIRNVNLWLWAAIAIASLIEGAIILGLGLSLDTPSDSKIMIPGVLGVSLALALLWRWGWRNDRLSLLAGALGQLVAGSFAIATATYLGAYAAWPLADAGLIACDHLMGFEWRDYVTWIDRHPDIAAWLSGAYDSGGMQFMVVLPFLYVRAPAHGVRTMVALFGAGMCCALLFMFFPAEGGYLYYAATFTTPPTVPAGARGYETLLMQLHNQSITALPYPGAGIVSFPSYHTAVAIILVYGASASWLLLVLAVPLNIALIASTPFVGAHYLADILGGVLVALLGIACAEAVLPRRLLANNSLGQ